MLVPAAPALAQESLYTQRGSVVKATLRGSNLRIVYENPSEERRREGAKKGDPLFTGTVSRNYAEGMAWLYDSHCGNIDYHVYGDFRPGRPFTLNGAAPVYGATNCKIVDNVYDSPEANLAFVPVAGAQPRPPAGQAVTSLPPGSALCVTNVNTTLNLRVGPGVRHPVIAELDAKQCGVTMVGTCQSGWCPVKAGEDVGWASSEYLRASGS